MIRIEAGEPCCDMNGDKLCKRCDFIELLAVWRVRAELEKRAPGIDVMKLDFCEAESMLLGLEGVYDGDA